MSERLYTREELLAVLALQPCHVTGMHTPEHHIAHRSPFNGEESEGYVCEMQLVAAVKRLLGLLEADVSELPHELHGPECGWCHRPATQEKYRARQRLSHAWAGVPVSPELAAPGLPV